MNILYLKYALEVARTGSINKAAENLFMAQPNLSRAIKELEASLGTTVFERTSKGMSLTPDGELLIAYAEKILGEVDELETMFRNGGREKLSFSLAAPYADYIATAFADFTSAHSDVDRSEFVLCEAPSHAVIDSVLRGDCKLGIVRYSESKDKYFKDILEAKSLNSEFIADFTYQLVFSCGSKLAKLDSVSFDDLSELTEVLHSDPSSINSRRDEAQLQIRKKIYAHESASCLSVLCGNPNAFMWVCPISKQTLDRFSLVSAKCTDNQIKYKDMLIYRSDYRLSELDKQFITSLCLSKRNVM